MGRLTGRVAMVTGCAGEHGFGRAIARRLAAEGADLLLTDVAPAGTPVVSTKPGSGWGGLPAVAEEVQALGRRALTALVDVTAAAQVAAAVERAVAELGGIHILVNNAAAPPGDDRVPVVELSEAAWDRVLDVNLKGTFLCSRAVAPVMIRQGVGGRIVNIGSDCSKVGRPRMAAYCASKFGVVGFTQALALELAPHGITVNAVCPGAADTERLDYLGQRPDGTYDPALRAARIAERAAAVPLGRLAKPEDVAEVVAFLCSDGAAYLTGQALNVSGGAVCH